MRSLFLFALLALLTATAHGAAQFTLHEKSGAEPGQTLLVVGGIQGDEPGGFMAASLLLTHYTITRGTLRVVPNLNVESIVARNRGIYGDMNRKFAALRTNDPEQPIIERIKAAITDPQVSAVLNLHDGSGYYREHYVDKLRNPLRWGQSTIIDQASVDGAAYGDLLGIASRVNDHVNAHLVHPDHGFAIRDTRTREGDVEMAKTLTFFAVEQSKPAFGIEASKELKTALRTYYHLQAMEGFMNAFDIGFERHFELTPDGVAHAIAEHPQIAIHGNKLIFDVANPRPVLNFVPLKKGTEVEFKTSSPVVAMLRAPNGYQVCYGNRHLTLLRPEFREYDDSLEAIDMVVDGVATRVPLGTIVPVQEGFEVAPMEGYRVNLIGFSSGSVDEAGIEAARDKFVKRFSVDLGGHVYRVEIYRGEKFSGMVLVDFSPQVEKPALAPRQWFAGTTIQRIKGRVARYKDDGLGW